MLLFHVRILIACEFSGIVRDAFLERGHNAVSCDLLPSERPGPHYQGDVLDLLWDDWDLMLAFPPCTHLAVSGARWFKDKIKEQNEALDFIRKLLNAPIPKICLENPVGIIGTRIRKVDQIIHPWQFGHETTKPTCLWLKGLPLLEPTNIVSRGVRKVYLSGKTAPLWHNQTGRGQGKRRSVTFEGIAKAMAAQWG